MSAKATIEHANKGQMGHPAACMMENKVKTPSRFIAIDYVSAIHSHELWITLWVSRVRPWLKPHEY
jgi:hypothetical protein